jgi:hypothetical protein
MIPVDERKVVALERIAESLSRIADVYVARYEEGR